MRRKKFFSPKAASLLASFCATDTRAAPPIPDEPSSHAGGPRPMPAVRRRRRRARHRRHHRRRITGSAAKGSVARGATDEGRAKRNGRAAALTGTGGLRPSRDRLHLHLVVVGVAEFVVAVPVLQVAQPPAEPMPHPFEPLDPPQASYKSAPPRPSPIALVVPPSAAAPPGCHAKFGAVLDLGPNG